MCVGILVALCIAGGKGIFDIRQTLNSSTSPAPFGEELRISVSIPILIMFASLATQRSAAFVDRYYGSLLDEGSITVLAITVTLVSFPVAIVSQAVNTIFFPRFSWSAAQENFRQFYDSLKRVLAVSATSGVLFSAGYFAFTDIICDVFLKRSVPHPILGLTLRTGLLTHISCGTLGSVG